MELERIGARIRPRRAWEGIDLGFALARQWFLPLWTLWWVTAAPLTLATLLLLRGHPDLWPLAIWWLKPLYEAPLIAWLGRALFGEQRPLRASLRRLPAAFPRRLWPYLAWRRLSPVRSLTMTLTLLENLRGGARRARTGTLAQHSGAGWLTLLCVNFEGVLWLSGILLLVLLVPEPLPMPDAASFVLDDRGAAYWVGSVMGLLAISIVAPFYVGAGFAAYLTRRTELEAWDLELRFRHGGERRGVRPPRPAQTRRPPAAAVPALLIAAGLAAVLTAGVRPATALDLSPAEAGELIDEVLAGADFGHQEERRVWVYVGKEPNTPDRDRGLPDGVIGELITALATALKWLMLAGAAVGLALLLRRLISELGPRRRGRGTKPAQAPAGAAAEPLPAASALPVDLPGAVRELLAAGQARAALALLYRAQIAHLRQTGLDIPDSATEGECIAAAGAAASPSERAWLHRLTALWQRAAYAHGAVAGDDIEQLLAQRPAAETAEA